ATCEQPVNSMDYYPTLLELAGLDLHPELHKDGISLVPFLTEPQRMESRRLVWHYPHYHGSMWRPGSAIRVNQWKLIEFYESSKVELYDLTQDTEERNDLSGLYPARADSLRKQMHQVLDEMGARYPKPKSE
ncbi:MAG: DUF4976 domain-containing protein, partial [Bacteroidales bacterium]|nr:DUF4976 domain-containing protein [Bacteroidales bacterium]